MNAIEQRSLARYLSAYLEERLAGSRLPDEGNMRDLLYTALAVYFIPPPTEPIKDGWIDRQGERLKDHA